MDKYSIFRKLFESIAESTNEDSVDLFTRILGDTDLEIKSVQDFWFKILYPFSQFCDGLIISIISDNQDVRFIFKESVFLERHLEYWITKKEGFSCCADKSRTIINSLIDFYKNGNQITFDYLQEYTFHLPKEIFTTHSDIIEFYEAVRELRYGSPVKYFQCISNILKNGNKEQATAQ